MPAALATLVASSDAAVFVEAVATTDTDVIDAIVGGLEVGVNVGGTSTLVINGVSFAPGSLTNGSAITTFGPGGGSADYTALFFENQNGYDPTTITIPGLTAGSSYAFQIFANSGNNVARRIGVTVQGDVYEDTGTGTTGWRVGNLSDVRFSNTVEPSPAADDGAEFLTYTFTASTSGDFTAVLSDDFFSHVSAYSLVQTGVPEPSSALLVGLAGAGFLVRRRKL